jgi:hypothetical protein
MIIKWPKADFAQRISIRIAFERQETLKRSVTWPRPSSSNPSAFSKAALLAKTSSVAKAETPVTLGISR